MAVEVFTAAYGLVNAVDLSDHIESVKIDYNATMLEITAMGMSEHRFIAGLKDWSIEVVFFQDYASGSVDATLHALVGAAAFAFEFRKSTAAVGVTNPKRTGSAVLEGHQPLSGSVDSIQKVNSKLRAASALTRATA